MSVRANGPRTAGSHTDPSYARTENAHQGIAHREPQLFRETTADGPRGRGYLPPVVDFGDQYSFAVREHDAQPVEIDGPSERRSRLDAPPQHRNGTALRRSQRAVSRR